nr:allantoate amidohydrolase [uncultured Tolumonas sp.]
MSMPLPRSDMEAGIRIFERCNELALLSEDTDALTRVYLSKQHQQANQRVGSWMRDAGMHVWQDAVGNICGRYEGTEPEAPALLLGSHLDTVRNAGKYDGMLGVITAIELVSRFHQQNKRFPFAIEVIGFGDEEGVRFGVTLLGSRGLAGGWGDGWLDKQDNNGISLAQALHDFGLAPEQIHQAKRKPSDFIGYLELHIEQGPLLESSDLALGVVTAINGAKRLNFSFKGVAGHAGTVPMSLRQDALVGASELVLAVESIAQAFEVVATVGKIECHPGAVNVIPSDISFSLDIRAPDNQQRDAALWEITKAAKEITERRNLTLSYDCFYNSDATPCSVVLQQKLTKAVMAVQGRSLSLASGAGHDAIAMASLCDVGMLFMRCEGGISHNPLEAVQIEDIKLAIDVLEQMLYSL